MLQTRHVVAAAELGTLGGEPDAHGRAVALLADALRCDAGQLVAETATGPQSLATRGYPSTLAWHATHTFRATPWWSLVSGAALPPSISELPEAGFQQSAFFEQHLEPAGFRDGLSVALRRDGQLVGMAHFSAVDERTFDRSAREFLGAIGDSLARLVDRRHPRHQACPGCCPPDASTAAWSTDGGWMPYPGRTAPPVLADPDDEAVVLRAARTLDGDTTFLLRHGRDLHRLRLHRVPSAAVDGGAVLVTSHQVDAPAGLTERELQVLTALATGASSQAIADDLVVSVRTVHTHVERLLAKLACANRTEAALLARRDGLLLPVADHRRLADVGRVLARPGGTPPNR
ncbi:LuxR C-terminal-related transcriptional regulator [Egicoccus halophilus]|uniref:HTH luxR-type domain-containing protein n=1 Tax=Egicoccus halophilus TaxID=1670830 RepID=A0A8J3AEC0_9ACTN|nr:LuxR C-terminal-related transcriptional regulator [Egicoccus halophilus]GGI05526.1 hypothetical protein GCM10011354_14540 [Egicoccus halophilus]